MQRNSASSWLVFFFPTLSWGFSVGLNKWQGLLVQLTPGQRHDVQHHHRCFLPEGVWAGPLLPCCCPRPRTPGRRSLPLALAPSPRKLQWTAQSPGDRKEGQIVVAVTATNIDQKCFLGLREKKTCVSSPRTSRCSWATVPEEECWRRNRRGYWGQTGGWTHMWHTALWEGTSRDGTRTWETETQQTPQIETLFMSIQFSWVIKIKTTKHLTVTENKWDEKRRGRTFVCVYLLSLTKWCWSWQSPCWTARRWAGNSLLLWTSGIHWAWWTLTGCHWCRGGTKPGSLRCGIWGAHSTVCVYLRLFLIQSLYKQAYVNVSFVHRNLS